MVGIIIIVQVLRVWLQNNCKISLITLKICTIHIKYSKVNHKILRAHFIEHLVSNDSINGNENYFTKEMKLIKNSNCNITLIFFHHARPEIRYFMLYWYLCRLLLQFNFYFINIFSSCTSRNMILHVILIFVSFAVAV